MVEEKPTADVEDVNDIDEGAPKEQTDPMSEKNEASAPACEAVGMLLLLRCNLLS